MERKHAKLYRQNPYTDSYNLQLVHVSGKLSY